MVGGGLQGELQTMLNGPSLMTIPIPSAQNNATTQSVNAAYLTADLKDQLTALRETHALITKELLYEGQSDLSDYRLAAAAVFPVAGNEITTDTDDSDCTKK